MTELSDSTFKIAMPGRATAPGAVLALHEDSGPLVVASNHYLVATFKQGFTPVDGGRSMQVDCHRFESWIFAFCPVGLRAYHCARAFHPFGLTAHALCPVGLHTYHCARASHPFGLPAHPLCPVGLNTCHCARAFGPFGLMAHTLCPVGLHTLSLCSCLSPVRAHGSRTCPVGLHAYHRARASHPFGLMAHALSPIGLYTHHRALASRPFGLAALALVLVLLERSFELHAASSLGPRPPAQGQLQARAGVSSSACASSKSSGTPWEPREQRFCPAAAKVQPWCLRWCAWKRW